MSCLCSLENLFSDISDKQNEHNLQKGRVHWKLKDTVALNPKAVAHPKQGTWI